ncbi:BamA/TamA family outer membrane protein [Roseimaritima sediminicola]|uniref:hypothetical protein n=1 Tax=Roseimaritima sediminicola TaxID=2662066 RepID=UPI00129841B0|nr:hypothetical protein [Roseimaritima sediminicola]
MRSLRMVLAIVLGGWLTLRPAAAQTPATSSTDDRNRFTFEGNTTFGDAQLRDALLADPDFLLAAHPLGTSDELAGVMRKQLIAAYRRQGFPSPQIEVAATSDPVGAHVSIDEGSRLRVGEVRIHGGTELDFDRLRQRLTEPYPKGDVFPRFSQLDGQVVQQWTDSAGKAVELEKPVWPRGKPLPIDTENLLHLAVVQALKDLGYSQALALVRIELDQPAGTGRLVVQVAEEGPRDRVEEIEVRGGPINPSLLIQQHLGVQVGQAVDRQQIADWTRKLWESGRFQKQQVQFQRTASGTGRLIIEVEETPGLPPLDQPISERAEIYRRAQRWLGTFDRLEQDVVITADAPPYHFLSVQSDQGMILQVTRSGAAGDRSGAADMALIMDPQQLALMHSDHPERWSLGLDAVTAQLTFRTKLRAAVEEDRLFGLGLHFNVNNQRQTGQNVVEHAFDVSPADLLPFAYKSKLQQEVVDGVLIGRRGEDRLEVDIHSGEIRAWETELLQVRFEQGAFERLRGELLAQHGHKPNAYQPGRPLGTLAAFLCSPPVWAEATQLSNRLRTEGVRSNPHLGSALRRLAEGGLLEPADAVIRRMQRGREEERFFIPAQPNTGGGDWQTMMRKVAARAVLHAATDVFAEGEWPLRVTREVCLAVLGRGAHATEVIDQMLADPETGPLGLGTVAYLLSHVHRSAAAKVAEAGLDRLDEDAVQRDLQPLIEGEVGRWLDRMTASIAELTPEQREAVGGLFGDESRRRQWHALHAGLQGEAPAGRQALARWARAAAQRKLRELSEPDEPDEPDEPSGDK